MHRVPQCLSCHNVRPDFIVYYALVPLEERITVCLSVRPSSVCPQLENKSCRKPKVDRKVAISRVTSRSALMSKAKHENHKAVYNSNKQCAVARKRKVALTSSW